LKVPKDLPALLERVFEAFAWEGIAAMLWSKTKDIGF
jgi:hypothetical protein